MNGKINDWWRHLSLRTKVRLLIAQDLLIGAGIIFLTVQSWRNPRFASWLIVGWAGGATFSVLFGVWRKWSALHNPLFYLAAIEHDLGGDNAAPVTKEPT